MKLVRLDVSNAMNRLHRGHQKKQGQLPRKHLSTKMTYFTRNSSNDSAKASNSQMSCSHKNNTHCEVNLAEPRELPPQIVIYHQQKMLYTANFECMRCNRHFATLTGALPHFVSGQLCTVSSDDILPLKTYLCFLCRQKFCCKNGCLKHQITCGK